MSETKNEVSVYKLTIALVYILVLMTKVQCQKKILISKARKNIGKAKMKIAIGKVEPKLCKLMEKMQDKEKILMSKLCALKKISMSKVLYKKRYIQLIKDALW